jgi:hypothetical protein
VVLVLYDEQAFLLGEVISQYLSISSSREVNLHS